MLDVFEKALHNLHRAGLRKFGDEWRVRLAKRREKLKQEYASLDESDRDPIQYASLSARTAYVFAYAPTRAEYTREFLLRHRIAMGRQLFGEGKIRVVSFGGGPASELVGLIRYLEDPASEEAVKAIHYVVYDKDGDWKTVAEDVVSSIETKIKLETEYHNADAADETKMDKIDLSEADLVIFSYIMSELAKLEVREKISNNFRSSLSKLAVGSKILFIDNKHKIFIEYFRSCKLVPGLMQKSDNGDSVDFKLPELVGTFGVLSKLLDWRPRTDLNSVSKLIVRTRL
jgi:Putative SAM-dependent methyltransferase